MLSDLRAVRSVLASDPGDVPGRALQRATRTLIAVAIISATLAGVAIVAVLLVVVLPVPDEVRGDRDRARLNLVVGAGLVAVLVPVGLARGLRASRRALSWLAEERAPTDSERGRTLRLPLRLIALQAALWITGAAVLFALNVGESLVLALEIGLTVALGGVTTASISFLWELRLGRATVARALADAPPRRYRVPGVALRILFTWALGTTIPVTGVVLVAAAALRVDVSREELARAVLVLGGIGLVVGFGSQVALARSIAAPLVGLRRALRKVGEGELDVEVPVYEASEIGFVQAGFNRMVAGLRERERMRDLFGRHVGHDVAQRALEEGVELGGEEREAAAMFVDVIGSTRIAAQSAPTEVVALLNRFFAVVVEVTQERGGLVNKFEGDGALCVFGAPLELDDAAGAALAAARETQARLRRELPELRAGIGVSAGAMVAGNVGAAHRFEYTVIGDPVNEAARLCELSKDWPEQLLASEAVLRRAGAGERGRWALEEAVVLRGRSEPTRLAVPTDLG